MDLKERAEAASKTAELLADHGLVIGRPRRQGHRGQNPVAYADDLSNLQR